MAPAERPLAIAGLVPLSSVDWPGLLVATVFIQGCPWNCPYCHNHRLIPFPPPGQEHTQEGGAGQGSGEGELFALLGRRRGLLDGVVFSGGEALSAPGLGRVMEGCRELGFKIGLHSAGAYPERLSGLLERGLIDWIGLDFKALPEHYPALTSVGVSGAKAEQSLQLVLAAHERGLLENYEIRTTVFPELGAGENTSPEAAVLIAKYLRERGAKFFALQVARPEGSPPEFAEEFACYLREHRAEWEERCRGAAKLIAGEDFESFEYR